MKVISIEVFKIKQTHSRRRRVRQIGGHGSGRAGQTSVLLSGFLGRGTSHSILAGRLAHAVGSAAEARAQRTLQIHQRQIVARVALLKKSIDRSQIWLLSICPILDLSWRIRNLGTVGRNKNEDAFSMHMHTRKI